MITLTARISLLDSNSGTLSGGTINNSKSNISSNFGAVVTSKKQGSNPFIFGASILGNGACFEDSVPYYIGSISASSSGIFATSYNITINGNGIKALTIEFDTYNNQHPNSISIDGTTYADDDAIFTISGLTSASSHSIIISNWNTPNYPLRIQGIYVDIEIVIDNRNMLSIERNIADRSDFKLPSWGIISNTGNVEFNDIDGEVKDYAEQNLLNSGLTAIIELKNTLVSGKAEQVGKFNTDTWNYNNIDKVVGVSLKDDLLEWQKIRVNSYTLTTQKTMLDLYNYLKSITPTKWAFATLDSKTSDILSNTICKYPYLDNASLWSEFQKICDICALYIYKNNYNQVVTSYEFRS